MNTYPETPEVRARFARGHGTRVTANAVLGDAVSAAPSGQSFLHPWRPSLGSDGVRLSKGTVDDVEARRDKVPISGDAANGVAQPVLALDPGVATGAGESWVCVEITVDDKTGLRKDGTFPQIKHSNQPRSLDPLVGRTAVCLIVWQKGKPFKAVEGAMFNMRYERVMPAPGGGAVKHVFY